MSVPSPLGDVNSDQSHDLEIEYHIEIIVIFGFISTLDSNISIHELKNRQNCLLFLCNHRYHFLSSTATIPVGCIRFSCPRLPIATLYKLKMNCPANTLAATQFFLSWFSSWVVLHWASAFVQTTWSTTMVVFSPILTLSTVPISVISPMWRVQSLNSTKQRSTSTNHVFPTLPSVHLTHISFFVLFL